MDYDPKDTGTNSDWHEGDFKNLRIHEAKELINYGKRKPFSLSEDGQSWRYEIWIDGIDILFGEGSSKYSQEEIKEVNSVKEFLDKIFSSKPPFKVITEYNRNGRKDKFVPIKENQIKVMGIIKMFEEIVKKFNDLHGMDTGNRSDVDDGL